MAKDIKINDPKAPRARPPRYNVYNTKFFKELRIKHPEFKEYSDSQIKNLIKDYNGSIWKTVVDYRDGVELPKQLGFIFIGSCPRKKDNPNYKLSEEYKQRIQHRNWESDDYLAKIFYTNFESKYKFEYHELWTLVPCRDFSRKTHEMYPQNWKKYVTVPPYLCIARLYRRYKNIEFAKLKNEQDLLQGNYEEFDLDT